MAMKKTVKVTVLLCLLALVLIAFTEPVARAVLDFLFGGIVPGTSLILPPQLVLAAVACVFAAVGLLLLIKSFKSMFAISFTARHAKSVSGLYPADVYNASVQSLKPGTVVRLRLWIMGWLECFDELTYGLQMRLDGIMDAFALGGRRTAAFILTVAAVIVGLLVAAGHALTDHIIAVGKWMLPRLRRFDRWLERNLKHAGRESASLLRSLIDKSEIASVLFDGFRQITGRRPSI